MGRVYYRYGESILQVWGEYTTGMGSVYYRYGESILQVWGVYTIGMGRLYYRYGESILQVWGVYTIGVGSVSRPYLRLGFLAETGILAAPAGGQGLSIRSLFRR